MHVLPTDTGNSLGQTRLLSAAMYVLQLVVSAAAILATSASALNIPPSHLEARSDVDVVEAILSALKASAFCSSFASISEVTSTVIKTAPVGSA